jgi:excisionase family DNA binding protein
MIEELIDPEAAAKVLGIKTITVYKWVTERKIPFVKVGGALRRRGSNPPPAFQLGQKLLFRVSELDDWIEQYRVNKASSVGKGQQ